MNGSVHDVDEANSEFVGNVRRAATRRIGYVSTNGRKRECMQAVVEWGDQGC